MEDVIGGHTDPERFGGFLAEWRTRLCERTERAVAAISAIDGVEGLILAGSIGAGQPWPLSDIDLLPIYGGQKQSAAREAVEAARLALIDQWLDEGWWTGVDIGRLCFTAEELRRVFHSPDPDPVPLLTDDRWYHSIDKGYRGRPVHDPQGLAKPLAGWFTAHRFDAVVVEARFERDRHECRAAMQRLDGACATGDLLAGYQALLEGVKWLRTGWLERWGERDNSLARFGARFDRLAAAHGHAALAETLNTLSGLDAATAEDRMRSAPAWVIERRDRQWAARAATDEAVTSLENDRDTLRVSTQYELQRVGGPPFPNWLGIPAMVAELRRRRNELGAFAAIP